ncbi:hypothetical protein EIP91_004125 [Steccherinum ochraceum]|uniref:Uncharacterized protein n=1 Tax=Steccherinum ochraceum TaxID=92696 RepID=A0A4R0RHU7_9APHY|nr:hypothetical protein EIP91_004125 [Steccherinum ochraceum]
MSSLFAHTQGIYLEDDTTDEEPEKTIPTDLDYRFGPIALYEMSSTLIVNSSWGTLARVAAAVRVGSLQNKIEGGGDVALYGPSVGTHHTPHFRHAQNVLRILFALFERTAIRQILVSVDWEWHVRLRCSAQHGKALHVGLFPYQRPSAEFDILAPIASLINALQSTPPPPDTKLLTLDLPVPYPYDPESQFIFYPSAWASLDSLFTSHPNFATLRYLDVRGDGPYVLESEDAPALPSVSGGSILGSSLFSAG